MIVSICEEVLPSHQEKILRETGEEILHFNSLKDVPDHIKESLEVLLAYGPSFDGQEVATFERFPNLKWVQWFSAGIDDLDIRELDERGIILTNASGIHVKPMSEYVLMCMLHFEKDMDRYQTLKNKKQFDRSKLVGELTGLKVLLYGTGVIGQAIAKTLSLFDITVYGVNTSGKPVPHFQKTFTLEEAEKEIGQVDYVISLLPSTTKTRNFFTKEYLQKMKPESVFISIGRGDVVEEQAVVELIQSKALRGAAMDVFQQEPLTASSPLWECENLILTPHMSAKSIYYIDRCVDIFIKNTNARRTDGEMINVINTSREY
ncbi:D-2-hydroxyacid dehydrogenase [Niallia sp. 01092]|uniref:D-2-hydroxyacid dehydrogenase n=1 Tax=unclassified Niallia TaxID=2837522 RepID=UPI003FD5C219